MNVTLPVISIVIPTLNEAIGIEHALRALAPLRHECEIIVADGGSSDATATLAASLADRVIHAPRGRGAQMNAGAAVARGDIFIFLHADTSLPQDSLKVLVASLAAGPHRWGRFDVQIAGRHPLLPMIATMMNMRSRLTGIATGDQAMFMTRETFAAVGGFPDIPLMEDIAISRRLKRISPPLLLRKQVTTSGRRWESRGVIRTVVAMWGLRLRYWLGADPAKLARAYGYRPRHA